MTSYTWMKWPDACGEEVSRRRSLGPCEKEAVAVRLDDEGNGYPVCAFHARGPMLPLSEIIDAAARQG